MSSARQSIDYEKLRQDFVRAVARLCPGWLSNQRDDLVQGAVMRVMHILTKKPQTGEGEPSVSASYIHRVAYSALVDEIRRVTRRRETDLADESVDRIAIATLAPRLA